MKSTLRLGLYGCNLYRTRDLLAGARIAAGDCVEVVASYDIDPEKSRQTAHLYGGKAYESLSAFLADPAIDVVLISLPPYLHADAYAAAAEAGKDVYLEKPICVDAATRARVLETAARYPARCYVGLSYRFVAPFRKAAEILRRPEAGAILGVYHHWYAPLAREPEKPNWRHRLEQSGGQLVHHCCHLFDWFEWIGGPMQSVQALTYTPEGVPLPHEEREINAAFRYRSGAPAVFSLSQSSHRYIQTGTIHAENLGIEYQWGEETFVKVYRDAPRKPDEVYDFSTPPADDPHHWDRDALQMKDFIDAWRTGGPMPISIRDGVRTYDIATAIRESGRTGARLPLDQKE